MRKIQYIAYVGVALWLNVGASAAQSLSYKGMIQVKPIRLEQQAESLYVDIDFVLDGVTVRSSRGVDLIPLLASATNTYALPKVSIKGTNEYLAYERSLSLMSAKRKAGYAHPYAVEKGNKKRNDTIRYRYALPYEPWMADARLDMQRDDCGCGESSLMNVELLVDHVTLERLLIPYEVTPHLAYVQPEVEITKYRDIQAECFLDFQVNKIDIRPQYMNNPGELAKIRAMIDELKADQDIQISGLDIIGYASPEGTLENNKRLSEGRAKALRDYLASKYEFPQHQYSILFGGENWDGLVNALTAIDMPYSDEVLEIIAGTPVEKGRKARLMQLRGGAPYSYLLRNVFPDLRVAICKVRYQVVNFSVDQAREVIKKRPQNLSLNEMFAVANSYAKGSQDFVEIFETAVRMFPDNEVANLNAAAAAISRKDIASAERYLNNVQPTTYPAEYNNIAGLLYLHKGDFYRAETHLRVAASTGLEAASANLEELSNKKNNTEQLKRKTK